MAGITISNVSVSESQIVTGTTRAVWVEFDITNTTGYKLVELIDPLFVTIGGEPCLGDGGAYTHATVSIANNATQRLRARTSINGTASDDLQAAGLRSASIDLTVTAYYRRTSGGALQSVSDTTATGSILLDGFCVPGITLTAPDIQRCDGSGNPDDEGTNVQLGLGLTLTDNAWLSSFHFRAYYAEDRPATTVDSYVDLDSQISARLYNPATVTLTRSGGFSTGSDWYFLLIFGDVENATTQASVSEAFANVHLAGCGKGVAFGKFSASTLSDPRFECEYPVWLNGGVASIYAGWQTLTPGTNVTTPAPVGNGAFKAANVGGHVYIRGGCVAKSGTQLTTLPAGMAPQTSTVYQYRPADGNRVARISIATDGTVTLDWIRNLTNGSEYTTAVWVDCNLDFWR